MGVVVVNTWILCINMFVFFHILHIQGSIWILETDKLVSLQNTSQIKGTKEQKIKKDTIEVSPVKKQGKIIQHNLILTDPDGSQTTIQLLDCKVEAVSGSTMPSRKW